MPQFEEKNIVQCQILRVCVEDDFQLQTHKFLACYLKNWVIYCILVGYGRHFELSSLQMLIHL